MKRDDTSVEAFREKVQRLRNDLAAQGEGMSFATPPAWRLAWRLGWKWTPPLFQAFWINTLTMGGTWGVLMLILSNCTPIGYGTFDRTAAASTLIGAASYGLLLAIMVRHKRKRLRLPSWRDY